MRYTTSTLLLILLFLTGTANSQPLFEDKGFDFSGMYRVSYDNNILRYSDRDFSRAEDGTEYNQSPVRTLDDIRNDFRLTGTYKFDILDQYGRISASINFAPYVINSINNFAWTSLTYKQAFLGNWDFLINHFYEPYYFLRDYYDDHTNEYRACDFSMSKTKFKLYHRPIRLIEFVGWGEFKRYAYNEYFTEYDGDRIEYGGEVILRKGPWRIAGFYSIGYFDNTGFDSEDLVPPGEALEDTENGDGDYEEDTYGLSIYYSFEWLKKDFRAKFSTEMADRYYQTERSPDIDPIHHGRNDLVNTTDVSLNFELTRDISLEPGVTYYMRDSEASMSVVSDVKNYSRWVGWLEISYDF